MSAGRWILAAAAVPVVGVLVVPLTLLAVSTRVMSELQAATDCSPVTAAVGAPASPSGRWTAAQLSIARTAVAVGKAHQIPEKGWVIEIAAGLVESGLANLDHGDRDSVGWLQQRPSSGWGTVAQIRDPALAAAAFYGVATHTNNRGLVDVFNWQAKPVGVVAQSVQVSAFPSRYAAREADARAIVAQVAGTAAAAGDCAAGGAGDISGPIRLIAELNPRGAGNWQGAVKSGPYWYVAHATAGDRTQVLHRLNTAGVELDQMVLAGGFAHATSFGVIGDLVYATANGYDVVTFPYRAGTTIRKAQTRPTPFNGYISIEPQHQTAVIRNGNHYQAVNLATGQPIGKGVRTPTGPRQGFSISGDTLYVLTGPTNQPARVDTYSLLTGAPLQTRDVTAVGFKPGENRRSHREPEGMFGNVMGIKVLTGDARRLRVYALTGTSGSTAPGKVRTVVSQGRSYGIPIPAGRAGVAVNFALDQLGDRYVWAAHGPDAWDCSGLTGGAWIAAGVRIPQQSDAQNRALRHVPVSQMRPGDILWHPGHVQLYLGVIGGKRTVVEAANPRVPVRIDTSGWMPVSAVLRPGDATD